MIRVVEVGLVENLVEEGIYREVKGHIRLDYMENFMGLNLNVVMNKW